ncbi:MAG TPA: CRISPR-associated protein Cas4 [Polyangiaceae bacterium]|nr:CRISPR-associated protein Cas4 [Polyangiaceae bacterium]
MSGPLGLTVLRVSDARQWTFCKRVLWHRLVMPHRTSETPKMALGRMAEADLRAFERRRLVTKYGLASAVRRFDVWVDSGLLGVRGVCDLVLDVPASGATPRRLLPVEVKRTEGGVSRHHLAQLAGYGLCLEEMYPGAVADVGFVLLLPADRVVAVPLGADHRDRFRACLREIREMIAAERFPEPTRFRSFCPQCEYVNFCGDVL